MVEFSLPTICLKRDDKPAHKAVWQHLGREKEPGKFACEVFECQTCQRRFRMYYGWIEEPKGPTRFNDV